ncbi:MAG: CHAT domain-containing protein [Lewinellaceae bacterium]|nr:CHAT domain-containing protein [Lewinellaceae bacterium]
MSVIILTYANSEQAPLQHLRDEDDRVNELLSEGRKARHFLLERDQYATPDKIAAKVNEFKDELEFFSYSGHAGKDVLFTEDGAARAEGIAHLLGLCPFLKVVFLNGCATVGQVKALLEKGIPAVIATYAPVGDELAKDFSIAFFDALRTKNSLEQAFEHAKGFVLMKSGDLRFKKQARGIGFAGVTDRDWGLFWREDKKEILQWTLPMGAHPNTILKDAGSDAELTKVFFVADKPIREKYYLKIRNSFHKDKNIKFNDLFGVGDPIQREAVQGEIEAADAVVFLINGLDFHTLWGQIAWIKDCLLDSHKPLVFVKLPGVLEPLEFLEQEIGPPDAKLPGYLDMFDGIKDQPATLDGYILSSFKGELQQAIDQITLRNGIPHEKLREELLEFDLHTPSSAFKNFIEQREKLNLVALQGTNRCGQDLLLERLLGYLPEMDQCLRFSIDLMASGNTITSESQLWKELCRYLIEMKIDDPEIISSILVNRLKQKDILIILDNVATDKAGVENLSMVVTFWERVLASLSSIPVGELHQLYVFVINRAAHCNVLFDPGNFRLPHALLLNIEPIDQQTLADWHREKQRRFRNQPVFQHLLEQPGELLGDGYLSDVVFRICDRLNCKPVYAKLIKQ